MLKRIIVFIIVLLSFQDCKRNPFTPWIWEDLALSEVTETENFIFHYSPGDNVQFQRQEAFHTWTINQLGITCFKKIDYYKYRDRGHMVTFTGKEANGWADPDNFAIHSIWDWDNHECTHCYTALIGRPSDFFNEGIAVAMSTDPFNSDFEARWRNESVHFWARQFKDEGVLIPLDNLLETDNFRSYKDEITYPESGSFVRYLIDKYGFEKMKNLFELGNRDDPIEAIKQTFESVYGFPLNAVENDWLLFIDNYNPNSRPVAF